MDHILVAEDDKEIRQGIEIYLKSQGYQVFQAADGIEGLEIAEKEKIHLAIVDVMMPRMDGIRMTEKLREKYQVQLESYADALERMTGRKVREKIIYSFALGQEILIE